MSQLPEPLDSAWIKPKHFDDHSWRKYIWYTHGNGNGNVNGWGWVCLDGWGNGVRTIYNHYQVSVPLFT